MKEKFIVMPFYFTFTAVVRSAWTSDCRRIVARASNQMSSVVAAFSCKLAWFEIPLILNVVSRQLTMISRIKADMVCVWVAGKTVW